MKFVKVKNHIFNIDNIFDIVYLTDVDEHFNNIGFRYFVIPIRGNGVEIKQDEYNELLQIISKINYSETEA